MIKLRILRWRGYPGLSRRAKSNHKGPYMSKREAEEVRMIRCEG